MGEPKRHHYIPVFYLKRWCSADGMLCEFSKPYGQRVNPQRKHPSATGYSQELYTIREYNSEFAQQIESKFFRKVDSLAADALLEMENRGNEARWNSGMRSAWSRFLISLLMRCPEDLELFRESWQQSLFENNEEFEKKYKNHRKVGDPETFSEFIHSRSIGEAEFDLFNSYIQLIDHKNLGEKMNEMVWKVIDLKYSSKTLFTSDRPVIRTNGLAREGGHIILPIGPRRLFLASPLLKTVEKIESIKHSLLARELNSQVVTSAVKYVYDTTDRSLPFIQKSMLTVHQNRLMESVLRS
ncbi:DUF4238 domain-containing protein [Minwuia thermotolerans]|uniref:DUF4238 domain-containing protein n=1 Tax=Minwuia thermotolerans TaxID=2056226 RepID=A0A2M9FZZ8_9PROT|nr:DUF4238 domain-containing protein [Minwuia thermotolerans]PJK29040.1 hypothetical protein CVT23_14060 [Minwuia thermotolerans]